MLYINEWFPNPVGSDATGEFVELYNSAMVAVNLNGYTLSVGAKKRFSLSGYRVPRDGYLVLKKAQDKLTLKNTDGALLLYGPGGDVVDKASFAGAAPEGKSFSRMDYGVSPISHFSFEYPTPGAANKTIDTTVHVNSYPLGVPLSSQLPPAGFVLLMVGTASFFVSFSFMSHTITETYRTSSSGETKKLGFDIGRSLARGSAKKIRESGPVVLALQGDLGAGKTTFVQGFLKGLGSKKRVASPTFVLMRRHALFGASKTARAKSKLLNAYHIDAYRLKKAEHLAALGFDAILNEPRNVVLIEWPEQAKNILPKNAMWLKFKHGAKEDERIITIKR